MVRETFLKFMKKFSIPFGVISTATLFANTGTVSASTLLERGDVRNGYFSKKAIEERGGSLQEFKDLHSKIEVVLDFIIKMIKGFNEFPHHVTQFSVDLMTNLYRLLMFTLQTPTFIFNNSLIRDTSLTFTTLSMVAVTLLTMFEMIKKMIRKQHTDMGTLSKRYGIAVVGAGFAPFLFQQIFSLINKLSVAITHISASQISSHDTMSFFKASKMQTATLLGFDAVVIYLILPLILQNGRRFFDLMCLSTITPLALTAWIFDDYRHLYRKWWNNIKNIASVQLIYSVFICIMGAFIFGTGNALTGWGMFLKPLIIIGGLSRMANPPAFVRSIGDHNGDAVDASKGTMETFKKVKDTVTFKNFKPITMYKKFKNRATK